MKKSILGAIILISIFLVSGELWAINYYVAQKNPVASDENPGTEAKPWKSINRSLKELKAGDTLYVREGVYRESVVLRPKKWKFVNFKYDAFPSGTGIDKPIRFIAWPGEEVFIKGSDVVTGWTNHKDNIWVKDWDINSQQVFCDDVILQQIAGKMPESLQKYWRGRKGDGLKDIEAGSFYYDIENKKMYVWLKDSGDPNQHLMEISARPFLFKISVDYVHVSGFKMTHAGTATWVNWPACGLGGSHNVMENCEITWTDFIGIGLSGNSNVIRKCKINHHGNSGMAGRGWGIQVLDCEISHNNYRRWSAGWHAGGMKIIPGAHNWIVSGCLAEHNIASDGIWFDADNANILIQNCVSRFNDGNGIHYEISERGIIRNNICYENKAMGIYLSNSSDCIVQHNLCTLNGMSGIVCIGVSRRGGTSTDPETGYQPARNNFIVGNILIDNCNPAICPKGTDHTGNTWPKRPELIIPDPTISSNSGCFSDYNIFYRSDARTIPFWENWGAGIYKDLKEWQEKTGNDQHSVVALPKFKDWVKRDFHPAKGSVAIQFVRPQRSAYPDKDGVKRPRRTCFLTAGPYAAPKEFLKIVKKDEKALAKLVTFPLVEAIDLKSVPATSELLKELASLPEGKLKVNDIPFALSKPLKALVLNEKTPNAKIKIDKRLKELYLLIALLNPGKGVQFKAVISRDDGRVVPLRWENTKNIGPSLGEWHGKIDEKLSPPIKGWAANEKRTDSTQVAWSHGDKEQAARLFITSWKNENEWLPVKELKLKLEDQKATVLILGVSALSLD